MAYTKKFVNGVLQNTSAGDVTALNARDAEGWTHNIIPSEGVGLLMAPTAAPTARDKLARMAVAYGMTADEFKAVMRE
jgi:hypothetical protein